MTPSRKLAPLAAAAGLLVTSSAHAATLVEGEFQMIGDTNAGVAATNPGISVTSGSAGYSTGKDGYGTGGLDGSFNAPILDYGFYTTGTGSLVESFGGAASLIPLPSNTGTTTDGTGISIWAGSATSGAADQSVWSRPNNVSGTVDISSLASGSFYMFFGTRVGSGDTYDITFSLTGAGQTTLNLSELNIWNGSLDGTASNNTWFVYRADFADAADYDTLTYTYGADSGNVAHSRFGGTVLTSVPEPSAAALLGGLGMLALLRRRA